jgi:hypothetical protein
VKRPARLITVLQRREERSRLELARLSRELAGKRQALQAMDGILAAIQEHLQSSLDGRFAGGPRTIAALEEIEEHARTLRSRHEELSTLKQQAEQALEALAAQHRARAHQWRRNDTRLKHIESLARRDKLTVDLRISEASDEAYIEGRSALTQRPSTERAQ